MTDAGPREVMMRFRSRLWSLTNRSSSLPCRPPTPGRRVAPPDDGDRAVDLGQWLELTGSDEIEATSEGVEGARRLQGKLLDALDDPRDSVVPTPADLDQEEWEQLPPNDRVEVRRAALRRIDPRLVPRTVWWMFGQSPSTGP